MSRASHALGLLDALFDRPAQSLARVFTIRQLPRELSGDLSELVTALTSPDAVWRHVSQLTADDIDVLLGLPETGENPLAQSLVDSLLAVERGGNRYAIAEIAQVVKNNRPQREPGGQVKIGQSGGEALPVDVAGVFDHLEQIEAVVDALESERPLGLSEVALAKGLNRESADVSSVVDAGARLGLITVSASGVAVSPAGSAWLRLGAADKWKWCVEHFIAQTPTWWPRPLPWNASASSIQSAAVARYPLVSADDAERLVALAHRIGLVRVAQPTVLDRADTAHARSELIDSVVPAPVNQLYPDGPDTLVAAGPLNTETTTGLRQVSSWLSGELAPRFRVDAASIARALQSGVSAESVRAALTRTVSVGMAPALMEMVDDTIARASDLTVHATPSGSLLTSNDALTLELIVADRRLQAASFRTSDSGGVESPLGISQVHDLLLQEGYPHLIEDASGNLLSASPNEHTTNASRSGWSEDDVVQWRAALKESREAPGFFDGVLELAISERVPITVTVSMGETTQEMTIEPHALRNGRLRGRDMRSEVERTLPVSHVLAVRADPTLS